MSNQGIMIIGEVHGCFAWLVDAKWCEPDPSRTALSQLLARVQPREWYFGHFHKRSLGEAAGCKWTALNMVGEGGSWVWLA